jgi:hypothetical protein
LKRIAFTPISANLRWSGPCTLAVSSNTGMCEVLPLALSFSRVVGPSISGIMTSRRIASGCSVLARSIPGIGEHDVPPRDRLQAHGSNLPDIVFVVDD